MSGEIVKYHNDMNLQALKGFNSEEMNLLMVLLSRVRDHGEEEVQFTFDQLRSLSKYKAQNTKRFVNDIKSTNDKLLNLTCSIQLNEDEIVGFALFPQYTINTKNRTLTVKVAQKWTYLVNNMITGEWTRFELEEFAELTSKYAKALYRQLKQWKYKGEKTFTMEEFRYLLDIPDSYQVTNIDRKVLNPCMKELSKCFENLRMEKTYDRSRRGRPSVNGYKFTWKPEKRLKKQLQIASSGNEKAKLTCPVCGAKAVIELTAKDGHLFWKCEECKKTFGSIAEVKGISEIPSRTPEIEPTGKKDPERYIPSEDDINGLKKVLRGKSVTMKAAEEEQKADLPEHDIRKCHNPEAWKIDEIVWEYVKMGTYENPIIRKGELRKILRMDKNNSDEDLLQVLNRSISVLVDLGWYEKIEVMPNLYKNGNLKDVMLVPILPKAEREEQKEN
jgi:plasmid replication initiation protein